VLRAEDSVSIAMPVIDPSSREKTAVPRGRSNYPVLGEIARGGMGVILKGHDTDLGRDVAVKVLDHALADHPEVVQRFVEEAQIGGQLQHPGIVPVYELGTMKDERPFFTMKLVKGRTLAALLAERESPATDRRRLIDVFEAVCQTMGYAHARGVIHRDLKPANVMVGAFGEVQVVDWGLAKVLVRGGTADEKRARATHAQLTVLETVRSASKGSGSGSDSMVGSVMGTPAYMPPEQASGHVDRLDERSDVFALGAILCEILTGLPPYVGERDAIIAAAAQAECDGAFARLEASGADPELVKLTKHCLMPAAAARPANAGVLAERVHAYVVSVEERAHAAQVESAAARVRVEQERKRRRLTAALAASVVAILLVGGGSWAVVQNERTARERDQAARVRADAERDARLAADVGAALAEASVHEGGGRWTEALQAADRARALAEGGGASAELLGRIDTARAHLNAGEEEARLAAERESANRRLLAELLEAREPDWGPNRDDPKREVERFEQAFRAHGIDLDAGSSDEVAAGLGARGIGSEIALFLDSLAEARRRSNDERGAVRALEVAHAVDRDPLRADLREALASGELEVLRWIAASGFEDQPPITVELLGSAFEQLSEREAARAVYRVGIERFPGDFALHYRLGRLLTPPELEPGIRADMQAAVECYRAALALRPDSVVVRYYLGRLYSKLEQQERAVEQFDAALRQRPDDGSFLYHRADSLRAVGQAEPAVAIYRVLVERRDPWWVAAWSANDLGQLLLEQGDVAGARALFERAVAADRGQAQFWGGLFAAVLASGSAEERQRLVERTLVDFPDQPETINNLAWALATAPDERMRDLDEAIRLARRTLDLQPADPASWNTLGVALLHAGDPEGAIEALRESVRLQGDGHGVDWLCLAMAHHQLGQAGEARRWYERALVWRQGRERVERETARFFAAADATLAR
jgi:serine/threonine-protein kinase